MTIYIYQDGDSREMVRKLAPMELNRHSDKRCLLDGSKPITADEVYKTWTNLAHHGRWPWWIEVTKWE